MNIKPFSEKLPSLSRSDKRRVLVVRCSGPKAYVKETQVGFPVVITLLLAAPDAGQAVTNTPASHEVAATQSKERQLCKVSTITGSRVAQKKVCGTQAEWALINREAKDNLDKSVIGGAYCNSKGAAC